MGFTHYANTEIQHPVSTKPVTTIGRNGMAAAAAIYYASDVRVYDLDDHLLRVEPPTVFDPTVTGHARPIN